MTTDPFSPLEPTDDLPTLARHLSDAQAERDRHPEHSPLWIAADAVVAYWCQRLNAAVA